MFAKIINVHPRRHSGACLRRVVHSMLSGTMLAAPMLAALMLGASPAAAQDVASADAKAVVLNDIRFENVDPLQFARIVPSGLGGSVTINADTGAVTTIGQVVTIGSDQTRARFTVNAPVGTIMLMSGDPTVQLTRNGGTETMTATLIHKGGTGLVSTMLFGMPIGLRAIAPGQVIYTGGTLTVPGTQAVGTYEGSFTLTVAYL